MDTQRLLFAQPRRRASLAPIYVALLSLVVVGFFALAVALWPEEELPSASRGEPGKAAPAKVAPAPGIIRSRTVLPAPGRGRWA